MTQKPVILAWPPLPARLGAWLAILIVAPLLQACAPSGAGTRIDSSSVSGLEDIMRIQNELDAYDRRIQIGETAVFQDMTEDDLALGQVAASHPHTRLAMLARFYRGQLAYDINTYHRRHAEPVDRGLAAGALTDLDAVVTGFGRSPLAGGLVQNAQFFAGKIAYHDLGDKTLAYRYWEKCAATRQVACMNLMAYAYVTGEGGQRLSIPAAIFLHRKIYETGAANLCAAAHSADVIAKLEYFLYPMADAEDSIAWVGRATALLDRQPASIGKTDPCHRGYIDIDGYLFRLKKGVVGDMLLPDAAEAASPSIPSTVVRFITGAISKEAFDTAIGAAPPGDDRCTAWFDALWFEEIEGRVGDANNHLARLKSPEEGNCTPELIYARRFNP